MTIIDRKENHQTQKDRNVEIEIDDKHRKRNNWEDEMRLAQPFEGYWEEFMNTLQRLVRYGMYI